MKKLNLVSSIVVVILLLTACSSPEKKTNPTSTETKAETSDPSSYDPKRGEGKFTADMVKVGTSLDAAMAAEGLKVQGVKCAACHKLTDEKLVGPGWKGVTTRKTPEWIMNFITNPDPMIEKDPEVRAQLELCLVRMPNQALSDTEARNLLEFMRKNDGVK
jgi:hypothetical protein